MTIRRVDSLSRVSCVCVQITHLHNFTSSSAFVSEHPYESYDIRKRLKESTLYAKLTMYSIDHLLSQLDDVIDVIYYRMLTTQHCLFHKIWFDRLVDNVKHFPSCIENIFFFAMCEVLILNER